MEQDGGPASNFFQKSFSRYHDLMVRHDRVVLLGGKDEHYEYESDAYEGRGNAGAE
jgi:hypothetical protein